MPPVPTLRISQRVVATTEIRTACFPGTWKDDSGGRFPGLRLQTGTLTFPKQELQWPLKRTLAGSQLRGQPQLLLCSLLPLVGTALGYDRSRLPVLQARRRECENAASTTVELPH